MKVTKEQQKQMSKLREEGKTYQELGEEFNLASSTVQYHLNEDTNTRIKIRARERSRNLTKEQRRKINQSRKEYARVYYMRRYREDPEFRERHLERCKIYSKFGKLKQ